MSNYYDSKLEELRMKIEKLDNSKRNLLPSFLNINVISYVIIPFIIFILLIIIKPDIIMYKIKNKKTFLYDKKISYLKIFLFLIFIEIIIYFISNIKSIKK